MTPGRNRLDQIVRGLDGVTITVKHIWTYKTPDGVAWRDIPQSLKDAGTSYRKVIEPATVHHHGKVSGEVYWGVEVEWAFVAGFLSAEARATAAEATVAALQEALEPFAKAAEKTTVFNDYETVDDTVAADHITLGDLRRARKALATIRRTT